MSGHLRDEPGIPLVALSYCQGECALGSVGFESPVIGSKREVLEGLAKCSASATDLPCGLGPIEQSYRQGAIG